MHGTTSPRHAEAGGTKPCARAEVRWLPLEPIDGGSLRVPFHVVLDSAGFRASVVLSRTGTPIDIQASACATAGTTGDQGLDERLIREAKRRFQLARDGATFVEWTRAGERAR
jgi:hypothetical protein